MQFLASFYGQRAAIILTVNFCCTVNQHIFDFYTHKREKEVIKIWIAINITVCLACFMLGVFALPKYISALLESKYRNNVYARGAAKQERGSVNTIDSFSLLQHEMLVRKNYTFEPNCVQRILCGATCAALGAAVLVICSHNLIVAKSFHECAVSTFAIGLSCATGILLTSICACDLKARIIPYQLCWAYAATSVVWVILLKPVTEVVVSLCVAVAVAVVLWIVERAAYAITGASAIGAGDRRLAPIIAFQTGANALLAGLLTMSLVGAFMAVRAIAHGGTRKTYIPFAPALYAWVAVGIVINAFEFVAI